MRFGNGFKNKKRHSEPFAALEDKLREESLTSAHKLVLFAAVAATCWVCIGQPVFAGSLIGWGWNNDGQASVPDSNDFVAISAGSRHSLALKADGSIVGWGYNYFGQATPPVGNDFIAIAAGSYHSLALKSNGSLEARGANYGMGPPYFGQCDVPTGNNFVAVGAGYGHSLALKSNGCIVGWGLNDDGQINVPDGNDFIAISTGPRHNLGLRSDGSIVGWGDNSRGQCNVPDGNDFVFINADGGWHSLALKSDGSLAGWGNNEDGYGNYVGQSDVPDGNDFVAIAAGGWHSLALKADGSIVGWGDNGRGQATPPDGNDFIAIAGGDSHSIALKGTAAGVTLVKPNGFETLIAGQRCMVTWESSGSMIMSIQYSSDNGLHWTQSVPNAGSTGSYNWLVPQVTSQQCMLCISTVKYWGISDVSDSAFTIYKCTLPEVVDLNDDCVVNLLDFALIASYWLQCGNPFDPDCVP